jgi:hypothetical protein
MIPRSSWRCICLSATETPCFYDVPHQNAEGAALASLELHRALIALLVRRGVIPRDEALEAVDLALARVE